MSEKDNGGPAFPCPQDTINQNVPSLGMTLRDYFAAAALQGMYASGEVAKGCTAAPELSAEGHCTAVAQWVYLQADAMLAERLK